MPTCIAILVFNGAQIYSVEASLLLRFVRKYGMTFLTENEPCYMLIVCMS